MKTVKTGMFMKVVLTADGFCWERTIKYYVNYEIFEPNSLLDGIRRPLYVSHPTIIHKRYILPLPIYSSLVKKKKIQTSSQKKIAISFIFATLARIYRKWKKNLFKLPNTRIRFWYIWIFPTNHEYKFTVFENSYIFCRINHKVY